MDNYRRTMEVNFFAIVALNQRLLFALKQSGGRLIVVSSVCGYVSLPCNGPYAASKHALDAYVGALRAEMAASSCGHVAISVISPSTLKTPMIDSFCMHPPPPLPSSTPPSSSDSSVDKISIIILKGKAIISCFINSDERSILLARHADTQQTILCAAPG